MMARSVNMEEVTEVKLTTVGFDDQEVRTKVENTLDVKSGSRPP